MKNICEQVALYFYGEMTAPQAAQFKKHLDGCAACQREMAFLQATQAALVPPAAPQAVVERVLQTQQVPFGKRVLKPLAAGSVLVVLLAVCIGPRLVQKSTSDSTDNWVAYVSEEADEEYQRFLTDFEAFEAEF